MRRGAAILAVLVALAGTACSGDGDESGTAPATESATTEGPAQTDPSTTSATTGPATSVPSTTSAPTTAVTPATAPPVTLLSAGTCTELRRTVLAGDSGDALVGEAADLRVLYREAIGRLGEVTAEAPPDIDAAVATMQSGLEEFVALLDRFDGDLDALAAAAATEPGLLDDLQLSTPAYDDAARLVESHLDSACPR
jgi:hypothetical protein